MVDKGGKVQTQELETYQKEIFTDIGSGKHTTEKKKYWQEQTDSDKCYFHHQKLHSSKDCWSLQNAIQKAKDKGITQGQ
eukprot:6026322-Ditylum_brightwellii.AAC.1